MNNNIHYTKDPDKIQFTLTQLSSMVDWHLQLNLKVTFRQVRLDLHFIQSIKCPRPLLDMNLGPTGREILLTGKDQIA